MAIALPAESDENNVAAAAGSSSQTSISLENKKSSNEMIGGCSVCLDDQGTEENPLVYCDGCEVAVHQACYGIIRVPDGNWFCRKCESGESHDSIKCRLCPSVDGALKKTESGDWAHVVCALYIPEVRFGNINTMEPIEIRHIQADRYNKSCYLCEENKLASATTGAVMDCNKLGCKQSFHVTCAQVAGLLCEEAGHNSDNLNYCGYCKHHFRKMKADKKKSCSGSINNSSSPFSDSTSDSSQDTDTRCNTNDSDKNINRNTKSSPSSTIPTNLCPGDEKRAQTSQLAPSAIKTTNMLNNNNNTNSTANNNNNDSSNIGIELSSTQNSNNPPSTKGQDSPSNLNVINKKKNNKKSNAKNNLNDCNPSATDKSSNLQQNSANISSSNTTKAISGSNLDIYRWSSDEQQSERSSSGSTNSKKRQGISSNAKTQGSNINSPTTLTNNNYSQSKVASPSLSISPSPSSISPSASTKSSSNTTSSSLTSSTTTPSSSSPSPALSSPNITSRTLAVRVESPLASAQKTSSLCNQQQQQCNLLTESKASDVSLPSNGPNIIQTRINLDNPKSDFPGSSSSLLSTAVPHDHVNNPLTGISTTTARTDNISITTSSISSTSATTQMNTDGLLVTNASNERQIGSQNAPITDTHPTLPPLIIPVTQITTPTTNSAAPKSTAKSKPAAKSPRKKANATQEAAGPTPKPKASRAKRSSHNNETITTPSVQPEAPKRGKGRAAAQKAEAPTATSNNNPQNKNQGGGDHTSGPTKRKSRLSSNESNVAPVVPTKRPRKKRSETAAKTNSNPIQVTPSSTPSTGLSGAPVGSTPLVINTPPLNTRFIPGVSAPDVHDVASRYYSPMVSPYTHFDTSNASSSNPRSSLSRLFTSSAVENGQLDADDPERAFEELRDGAWSHLSRCILDQAQQFDIPSLIGTLYTLRSENEKLVGRVRDLTMRRDQLLAMNARLDLPGPMLTQHLNNTSPNFSSVVSCLTNSPKSVPTPSPGSSMGKQPLISVGPYNHLPPNSLGAPAFLDRSSPLVAQTHSGINNVKTISTPSPPIGTILAHNNSSRAGLTSVNSPFLPNMFPPVSTMAHGSSQPTSYYQQHRQP